MTELWLSYKDENGGKSGVMVDSDLFTVGRHSACSLNITNPCLSREHLKIERYGDVFVVSDAGSSNGTTLNGSPLDEPKGLQDGDVLELGGGLEINIRLKCDAPAAVDVDAPVATPGPAASGPSAVGDQSGIPVGLFIAAAAMLLLLMVFTVGAIFFMSGTGTSGVAPDRSDAGDFEDEEKPSKKGDDDAVDSDEKPASGNPAATPSEKGNSTDNPNSNSPTPPGETDEMARIERYGSVFLRSIAQNDQKAFLTTDQARRVAAKLKQIGSSDALAANITSAKKNQAQIRVLAAEKNLKPQFLAVAAITKLGSSRGDVLQTARGMTEILDKLGTQIGNELGEDSLLIIAAYSQGEAGDFMKLRNMLQDISTKSSESSREIRTIWFLQKNNRISPADYDRALTFLAIGVVTQNPREFSVNSEALVF